MFAINIIFLLAIVLFAGADPVPLSTRPNVGIITTGGGNVAESDLNTCEQQLTKYRRFILQAIVSFEDVCDAYNARPPTAASAALSAILLPENLYRGLSFNEADSTSTFFHNYQPPQQRSEIWAFFKLLMAQFNDVEFTNVIRDAVIERCRVKSQLQHDNEKRNSVVLGKKQRFHSWGGKRSPLYQSNGINGDNGLDAYYF